MPNPENQSRLQEYISDTIRFWEPKRILYNLALAAVVLATFAAQWPDSRDALVWPLALNFFNLAVVANVFYCAAHVADLFAQFSVFRETWRPRRWILFVIGALFAASLTFMISKGAFESKAYGSPGPSHPHAH